MEEMKNVNVENTVNEVVEVVTEKLTFKENCIAYALAGVFVTGLTTVGYLGYKGGKKIVRKIKDKRESKVSTEMKNSDDCVDVDYKTVRENENESK